MVDKPERDAVHRANKKVHGRFAEIYDEIEPHFRPENKKKVRLRIEAATADLPAHDVMIDIGCGTGFLLNICADLFAHLHGVDITPEMLARVDLTPGNITLHEAPAENLPIESSSADFVTTYSFLDHLLDPTAVFREAHRVLRPGGRFFSDLIPNRAFWKALEGIEISDDYSSIVNREIREVVQHEQKMEENWGVDPEDWRLTEPIKADGAGFDPGWLKQSLMAAGFRTVTIHHDWFLGEAAVIHGQSQEAADAMRNHLQILMPLSRHLFKYLYFVAEK